ncbi:MAG: mannose-1-phosphate guanylyltransferase/mannose-6-phosphate isomerase [Gammaproteobacteria bacterium]
MASDARIVPVILAGGGGTRLWPLSRGYYPKQFLAVGNGEGSLLQRTLTRLSSTDAPADAAIVVCNEEHRFLVAEQVRQLGLTAGDLILEPAGRNTAPALTAAACRAMAGGADPVLVMMPADHLIGDLPAFGSAIAVALAQAEGGQVATLGVVPTRAETGYGYIETGAAVGEAQPACHVLASFCEKPDAATAEAYVADGRYLWNSGIFIMKASVWLEHAATYCPAIAAAARRAVEAGRADGDFFRLDAEAFEASPSDSIDYAVMEPLSATGQGAVVVALDAGWSDVGSWSSLWQVSPQDEAGNVLRGDVCAIGSSNNIVFAEHRLVATLGCENLAVIETADAVLVADKSRTEEVKAVVDWLRGQNRDERLTHRRVYRPWGSYEGIDAGSRFQVKRITVQAGASLSLQMHHHRAEHWIVVAGTARVTKGDETFLLSENQSTYIPLGVTHRLENPGTLPLELIEVQSGSYLGEDDIVRFEDKYNRVAAGDVKN